MQFLSKQPQLFRDCGVLLLYLRAPRAYFSRDFKMSRERFGSAAHEILIIEKRFGHVDGVCDRVLLQHVDRIYAGSPGGHCYIPMRCGGDLLPLERDSRGCKVIL